ncbi:MAG: tetratricopeptide repeat protein, partial [Vulcanimicrobiaceae bacterium]
MRECHQGGIVLGTAFADLLVRRGIELEAEGRLDDAKHAFWTALRQAPSNADAINGLGRVLYREGSRRAARLLFERLVKRHPGDAAGHANLGIVLLEADDFAGARSHLERALALDPAQSLAHFGLSRIAAIEGDEAGALMHQRAALGDSHAPQNAGSHPRAPKLLLLSSEEQLGAVVAQRLGDSALSIATLVVEVAAEGPLQPHHAMWNTITDADRSAAALEIAARIAATTDSPVINDPRAVLATSRVQLPERLRDVEDAVLPRVRLLPREKIEEAGVGWPMLLRAPGYHSGQHFALAEGARGVRSAAADMPGAELLAIEYVDTRGAD